MKKTFSILLLVILVILVVVFTLQNSENVTIKFFSLEFISSLSLILFLTLTFGVIIAVLALSPSMIRDSKLRKSLKKKVKKLEAEVEKHKAELLKKTENNRGIKETGIDDQKIDNIYYKQ